ncbi:MAG: MBL fold metallo-hydrolase [Promethearchaeota archaeon]|jgi:glyoxylase-like metal-dependent hydrolase (beta-lactamase superfamily II)
MVFINEDGKFNENSYLFDGLIFSLPKQLSIYIIENDGMRMMLDTGVPGSARQLIKKLKEFDLFPIHKLLLTHSHWDHIQAYERIKKSMENEFETLASENAIENLRNPDKMNAIYGFTVKPIEDEIIPLKEGDIIDLNGLKLEILNLFGHTMDSIAILDRKNKNLFAGDAVISKFDRETYVINLMPPDFHEEKILNSYKRLRDMKADLNSICLNHFGVWEDEEKDSLIERVEEIYIKTRDSIIQWYNENSDFKYIAGKYHETFIPNSTIITKETIINLTFQIQWIVDGLKTSGFIN